MYTYQPNDKSGIDGLLRMVEARCSILMKQGGGPLTEDKSFNGSPLSTATRAAIVADIKLGTLTASQIADRNGTTPPTVAKIAQHNGLKLRRLRAFSTPEQVEAILAMGRARTHTIGEISATVGVPYNTVSRLLVKHNIGAKRADYWAKRRVAA